jgi:anti-sigma B factor antagonist
LDDVDTRVPESRSLPETRVGDAGPSSCDGSTDGHAEERTAFDIVVRSRGVVAVMMVFGEIDLATAPALYATLRRLREQDRRDVLIDLSSVSFMDASVLTFLLIARRELVAAGGSLSVVDGNPLLGRLLDASGLTSLVMGG